MEPASTGVGWFFRGWWRDFCCSIRCRGGARRCRFFVGWGYGHRQRSRRSGTRSKRCEAISRTSATCPIFRTKDELKRAALLSLIATAHRTTYVLQSSVANVTHLLEGYIEGLNSRRPAVISDETVWALQGARITSALAAALTLPLKATEPVPACAGCS